MNMTEAIDVAIDDAKGENPTFEFAGRSWEIRKKPPTLMLAEFARAEVNGNPEDIAVLAEFFELVLGDQYPSFRRAVYAADEDESLALVQVIVEKTMGRPTE
jgi:hypothetical protein